VSPLKVFCLLVALTAVLSGCAKRPHDQAVLTTQALPTQQIAANADQAMPAALSPVEVAGAPPTVPLSVNAGSLAGRTLRIGSMDDLKKLRPGEVILTFDDGPNPAITPRILATLADFEVKSIFFMVGQMARAHPETAQLVASAGHTIGSHSHGHENLQAITHDAALNSLTRGDTEISDAIKPAGKKLAPFFRFPYLNQTQALSADLSQSGIVIFGVDVDSWDYLGQSPDQIIKRTLRRLDARGRGVVLFHDIHSRTAKLLPDFLAALKERGYTVVRAVPKSQIQFSLEAIVAAR
jgi:peptidoglycan/xylan/chitin deacetylase (PgdA/CDA1 family)